MIVKLTFENQLNIPVLLRSDMATGQPLQSHQTLEMTFSLEPDPDGIADLLLIVEHGP